MREEFGIKIIDNHEEDEYGEIDESSYIEFRKGNEKEVNEEAVKKEILERVKEISIDDL
jgi:vacuolar-type H+-ATPase subunit C/Vma6